MIHGLMDEAPAMSFKLSESDLRNWRRHNG